MTLFYITPDDIREVPYTESRAKSLGIYFHDNRRDALIALKESITERVQKDVERLIDLEKEIANVK